MMMQGREAAHCGAAPLRQHASSGARSRRRRALAAAGAAALLAAAMVLPAGPSAAATGDIATVAGNGTPSFSGDGGPAIDAGMNWPYGMTLAPDGAILLVDSFNHRVRRVSTGGVITTVAGSGPVGPGNPGFSGDGGPAIDAGLSSPNGVLADAAGGFYIAGGDRVRRVDPGGVITTVAGGGTPGQLGDGGPATAATVSGARGLALSASGSLYISATNRVRKVDPNGVITTVAGDGAPGSRGDGLPASLAQVNGPDGLALDGAGNLYIAETAGHRVRRINPGGVITTVVGVGVKGSAGDGGPAVAAMLNIPQGLALGPGGELYVADSLNHRVRRVSPGADGVITGALDETITTVVGSGTSGFAGDGGPAGSAQLSGPHAVVVDSLGSLYVSDYYNHRIRRIQGSAPPVTPIRPPADFDGDARTDRSVYRGGAWYAEGQATAFLGVAGDIPVPADYDGNGTTDRAVYRDGAWYTEAQPTVFLGVAGDVPVSGDYNGDGRAERAVFRPAEGAWYTEGSPTAFLGGPGDVPVPGDYDGNGTTDRAVYRPSVGGWYVTGQATVFLGLDGDIPVPGDYDANGRSDRGVWRPSVGGWYLEGQATAFVGLGGDVPVPGDYGGDGTTDRAIWRPSAGGWYVDGQTAVYLGLPGDLPLPLPQAVYRASF